MDTGLKLLQITHVAAGFIGLAAFWVPIFTRKGGKYHRLFGKVFKYCAYFVLGAAFLSLGTRFIGAWQEGIGPSDNPANYAFLVFLLYLTVVTYVGLRHGLAVLRAKPDLTRMNRPLDNALAWIAIGASIGLIGYALYFNPPIRILLFALSPIGFGTGFGIRGAVRGRKPGKAWFYEHMGGMMGTGIAFHTAFAVFGMSRLFDLGLQGWVAIIPWITPALVGIPAIVIWTRHYRKKFGELAA